MAHGLLTQWVVGGDEVDVQKSFDLATRAAEAVRRSGTHNSGLRGWACGVVVETIQLLSNEMRIPDRSRLGCSG